MKKGGEKKRKIIEKSKKKYVKETRKFTLMERKRQRERIDHESQTRR